MFQVEIKENFMRNAKVIIKLFIPPIFIKAKRWLINFINNDIVESTLDQQEMQDGEIWNSPEYAAYLRSKFNRLGALQEDQSSHEYTDLLVFLINILSASKSEEAKCNVLDWGGGAGFIFFYIHQKLSRIDKVKWFVLKSLAPVEAGKNFAHGKQLPIEYIEQLSSLPVDGLDILFINTSIQYLSNYQTVFNDLLSANPKYIVLTRLLCAKDKTIITRQKKFGTNAPCVFVSRAALVDYFNGKQYFNISDESNWVESPMIYKMLPRNLRIYFDANPARNMVFVKN